MESNLESQDYIKVPSIALFQLQQADRFTTLALVLILS